MSFFQHFEWSFKSVAKVFGLVLLGIVAVTVVVSLIAFSFRTIFQEEPSYYKEPYYDSYSSDQAAESKVGLQELMVPASIMPPEPGRGYTPGADAESFEVKDYSGEIRTSKLEKTCRIIGDLKAREDIIFETSDQGSDSCHFRFKVVKEKEQEIVALIEGLKPEYFNAHITTIKKTIESYDTELDILKKKLVSIEDALEKAQDAYDELTGLATRKQDVETLATIIDRKLNLIERLTQERISVKEQIDRFNKDKADQLDRLNYTFFDIRIYEDLLVDWKQIKDSWKWEIKNFVDNFNQVIQQLTINLAHYLIRFVEVAIYAFISLILLRLAWVVGRRIWTWNR